MPKKSVFDMGDVLVTKLAALQSLLSPTTASESITEELAKQNYYTGYQQGVQDALHVFLCLLKDAKKGE